MNILGCSILTVWPNIFLIKACWHALGRVCKFVRCKKIYRIGPCFISLFSKFASMGILRHPSSEGRVNNVWVFLKGEEDLKKLKSTPKHLKSIQNPKRPIHFFKARESSNLPPCGSGGGVKPPCCPSVDSHVCLKQVLLNRASVLTTDI